MKHRTLGATGLQVSEIGLGAAQIGNAGIPEERAERVLNGALDLGINFIDTAAMYGESETRIGKLISRRRKEFVLATKCGDYLDAAGKVVRDYSPSGILATIDESRRRLRMDVIDIVQFHGLPGDDDAEGAFAALLEAKERGWTRFVGVSHDGPAAARAAEKWALDTQEFTYNVLYQEAARVLMPTLASRHMGTIIKRPISNAVWERPARPGDSFSSGPWDRAQILPLRDLAGDLPLVEFVLRFTLSHPGVCTAIVGTTNPDHLQDNVRIAEAGPLPTASLKAAEAAFAAHLAG